MSEITKEPDLIDLKAKLSKYLLGAKDHGAIVLQILEGLQERKLSLKELMKSKLSKVVFKLRKDEDEKIKSLASKLVNAWKKLLPKKKAGTPTLAKVSTPTISRSNSSNGLSEAKHETIDYSKGSITITPDTIRNKIREQLFRCFGGSVYSAKMADDVETAMIREFKHTGTQYKSFFRSLLQNLKDQNNPDLPRRILSGQVSPENLVRMKPKDFASDSRKREREKEEKMTADAARSDWDKFASVSDAFKCYKCKQRKCSYYQIQIRSSDEPMTTKVTCLNCGNRWNC
ncbi:hypothetical protein AAMO2058_000361200 [Amorphochlora amoebiformis]